MESHVDVLIVGAGISGIGMAAHLQRDCPRKTFRIIEQRDNIGGTWDLFRYPGIRSDSDMFTLGFDFEPWRHKDAIARGEVIRGYLSNVADERGIRDAISFGTKAVSASWSSADARWTLACVGPDGVPVTVTANFLYMGSGYYDYDQAHDAAFKGQKDFKGIIAHPQFWPQDLDYQGKRVVVIGSGATAITIVPAMTKGGAGHVTMLQRTPSWYLSMRRRDPIARVLRKIFPSRWAYAMIRFKNVRLQELFFKKSRTSPGEMGDYLTEQLKENIGDKYDPVAFTPPYRPWEQRMCVVPDNDFFDVVKSGKADIVTDHVDRFDAGGIKLKSGRYLGADIIVPATGLKVVTAGKVAFSVDGAPVVWNQHFMYKGCMFSGIPNMATVFGYPHTGWTLKTDLVGRYVCRLLTHLDVNGWRIATPVIADDARTDEAATFDLNSGYIERARGDLPRQGAHHPWRLNWSYLTDRPALLQEPIGDGALVFSNPVDAPAALAAAHVAA